ncbi:unnamed protein product [Cyprideis torosa]|uniref:Structural maintenance of chromosomes protein n=1 Tax=Cyprideis torosa TaxID=163714 RepID=A0A7R8W5W9_9CRUS|nr:unnamed protein product [Cyprideis torosa]CAG0885820.1 unnamed protein product [Cyprideis torosa]
MHIKQVIISGFKSYRELTTIEVFDPKHNVVVGRNGSGKSNFFQAIQFVLSDEFSYLRPEQRQSLLHEGTGPRVISAHVDIIFDNSDQRLPIDKDEVVVRRVIGHKKDQYFLNKKVVTRTDIMNLLESAGFSRSNPYYIVKQGKINAMATAPDAQRLKLLREVAGTRVYDERREESLVMLKETESKREKINEYLANIDERLQTLETEKEELKESLKWDKMRRSLEFAILERELKDAKQKLEEVRHRGSNIDNRELQLHDNVVIFTTFYYMDKIRSNSGAQQDQFRKDMENVVIATKEVSKELKEIKSKVSQSKEEKAVLNTEFQQLVKQRSKLELTIKDLEEEVVGDNSTKERADRELKKLEATIAEKNKELEEIKPQYEEMKKLEEECSRELTLKHQKRTELYAKQGRGSQFTSREERDKWIKNELRSLTKAIRDKEESIRRLQADIEADAEKKTQLEAKTQESNSEKESLNKQIEEHNKNYYEMKKEKESLQERRNVLYREETKLQNDLSSLKDEVVKHENNLRSMIGKPTLNGRESVRRVIDTFRERGGRWTEIANGYYGLVIENFECEESINTAVEVTAGGRLYFHIVSSDSVGTAIINEINRQQLPGEVTFMPINRMQVKSYSYPESGHAIPMIGRIKFEQKYEKAFHHIFGKTLICRNLDYATDIGQARKFHCVTLEGEQVVETEAELAKVRGDLLEVESKINNLVSEIQRTEIKHGKVKDMFDRKNTEMRLMREELNNINNSRGPKEKSLNALRASQQQLTTTKEGLESELHQDLLSQLSAADQREVDQLNDDIRRLTEDNKRAYGERLRLETKKNKIENLLANNLDRRRGELKVALQEITVEDRVRKLDQAKGDLEGFVSRCLEIQKHVQALDKELTDLSRRQKAAQTAHDKGKAEEKELQEKLDGDARDLEKISSKTAVCHQKIEECNKKINELGPVSDEELQKFANSRIKELYRQLEKANSELKKYAHVNKKALDQFLSFSDQKESLIERKRELDNAYDSIQGMMQVLEQRKYEAIKFTFKQVSMYFGQVFSSLVPGGRGQLIMKTKMSDDDEEVPPSGADAAAPADNFTGVSIKVSFSGRADMKEMNQLSGGQKSLVALALIFAIQKCDPAPFYLFDEIDQALDSDHRKAVAEMIHKLSDEAQFITTTFRPELLANANKFYGVLFRNKVSHVQCVTREEAYDFVEDDSQHG